MKSNGSGIYLSILSTLLSTLPLISSAKAANSPQSHSSPVVERPAISAEEYRDSSLTDYAEISGSLSTPILAEYLTQQEKFTTDSLSHRAARRKGQIQLLGMIRAKPLQLFQQLRAKAPILYLSELDMYLITRDQDVRKILSQPTLFTVRDYRDRMEPSVGPYMLNHDPQPEDPYNYYNIVEKNWMRTLLVPSDFAQIQKLVLSSTKKAILERSNSQGKLEVVSQVGRVVPIQLIQEYMGFQAPLNYMQDWSYKTQDSFFHNVAMIRPGLLQKLALVKEHFSGQNTQKTAIRVDQEGKQAGNEMHAYLRLYIAAHFGRFDSAEMKSVKSSLDPTLVNYVQQMMEAARRRNQPLILANSILGRMLQAEAEEKIDLRGTNPDETTQDRIRTSIIGGLVGGVETSNAAIVQSLNYFLEHPEILKEAIEQAQLVDPSAPIQNTQFAQMVWEALRFHPINPFVVRYVEKDQELSGVKLKEGSRLLVATHSAMMDPRSVKFPQQFMAKRPYEDRSMNLGIFQHRCLGDYVAEVMIPTVLYQLLLSPDIQRDQTATGRIGLNQNIDFGPRNSFPEKYVVTTSISPPPPSRIGGDSFPIPFSSASSLNSRGPGRLADLSILYERNDIMGFNDQRSNLNSDNSSFPTRNRNPMEIIVSGELKFFRYLSARDRVDDLIADEDGFDERKKNLKFRLCIVGISLANLDTDYFERENSYSFCARWAGIKTRLVPADIEQVYDRFPMDQLISQVLDEQGQPRPALVSLCKKNPLGKKTFLLPSQPDSIHQKHDEIENNWYCQLNLGFRACNLLVQKINPEINRDEAFQRCTEERRTRFPLSDTEKREYRQHLPHYLATDSP